MKYVGYVVIRDGLTAKEEERTADLLSTLAVEILKREYKAGKTIILEIEDGTETKITQDAPINEDPRIRGACADIRSRFSQDKGCSCDVLRTLINKWWRLG